MTTSVPEPTVAGVSTGRLPKAGSEAPRRIALRTNEVHVWIVPLDVGAQITQAFERVVSPAEWKRAGKIESQIARRSFVAGRGFLRMVLSQYTGLPAARHEIVASQGGRPELATVHPGTRVSFNLSQSGSLSAIAVTSGRRVGVDIEAIRPNLPIARLVQRFFMSGEQAEFAKLPEAMRWLGFYACWTLKEAYVKAHGRTLSHALGGLEVSFSPIYRPRLVHDRLGATDPKLWWFHCFTPMPGYFGSLAAEGTDLRVRYMAWGPIGAAGVSDGQPAFRTRKMVET